MRSVLVHWEVVPLPLLRPVDVPLFELGYLGRSQADLVPAGFMVEAHGVLCDQVEHVLGRPSRALVFDVEEGQ